MKYTVEPGRWIYRNGEPFASIGCAHTSKATGGAAINPTEADALTRRVVAWLNREEDDDKPRENMSTWSIGSRCMGTGENEWFFIVNERDEMIARIHPAQAERDEETGESCTGVADFAAIPDVRLMLLAPQLMAALRGISAALNQAKTFPADIALAREYADDVLRIADGAA